MFAVLEAKTHATRLSILGPVGRGILVYLLTVMAAGMIATVLLFIGLDWASYMHTVGLSIAFAGILLGSVVAGAHTDSRGWLAGLLTGGIAVLATLVVSIAAGAGEMTVALALLRLGLACLVGAIGGALGLSFSS